MEQADLCLHANYPRTLRGNDPRGLATPDSESSKFASRSLLLRELRRIQAEVGDGLPVELPGRRQLLALLELLQSALGLVAPASVSRARLETVLDERLLNLSDFVS